VVRRATTPASPSSEVFVEVVRLLIVAVFTAAGYSLGGGADAAVDGSRPLLGALLGACVGYVHGGMAGRFLRRAMGSFEARVERAPAAVLLAGSLGALLLGTPAVVAGTAAVVLLPGRWGWPVLGLLVWLGLYAGFSVGARKGEELVALLRRPAAADPFARPDAVAGPVVLVDSSAAMDGRLLGVAGSGFLPGRLAVPRFVLDELQGLADAADPTRRRRGRRALEALDALRHDPTVGLTVLDDEVPEREEVDAKLVTLARRLEATLLTGDGALTSVAELQGVACRSLDRLAAGLQTVLVPGEVVRLVVSRPGRDPGQGVGYLDDGTMVVVSDGAQLVGNETDVTITSSVRTPKGRMFFASPAA
jgi:uncharacterized protein YacL